MYNFCVAVKSSIDKRYEKIILNGKEIEVVTEVDEDYKSIDYLDQEDEMDTMDLSNVKEELDATREFFYE